MADSDAEISSASNSTDAAADTKQLPQFVCVEFPARVQNVDKMLNTLGGEEAVSKVSWSLNGISMAKMQKHFWVIWLGRRVVTLRGAGGGGGGGSKNVTFSFTSFRIHNHHFFVSQISQIFIEEKT